MSLANEVLGEAALLEEKLKHGAPKCSSSTAGARGAEGEGDMVTKYEPVKAVRKKGGRGRFSRGDHRVGARQGGEEDGRRDGVTMSKRW